MATVADILTKVQKLSTDVDALIAAGKPADLQPISDALDALDAKVTAAIPAAPAP